VKTQLVIEFVLWPQGAAFKVRQPEE